MAEPPGSNEDTPSARTERLLRFVLADEAPTPNPAPGGPAGGESDATAGVEPIAVEERPAPDSAAAWIEAVAEAVKEADERASRELSAARGRVLIAEERVRVAEERARLAEEEVRAADERIDAAEERARDAEARSDAAEQRLREAEARAVLAEQRTRAAELRAEAAEASLRQLYEALEAQARAAQSDAPEEGETGANPAG